jgi:TonB family protein
MTPEELKSRREALGMTPDELSERLGKPPDTLSGLERGAGVSQATWANLRRRIEHMLSSDFRLNRLLSRRTAAGAGVVCMIALVYGLEILSGDHTPARSRGEIVSVAAGAQTRRLPPDWYERIAAAPARQIRVENPAGAPLTITDAKIRLAEFDGFYAVNSQIKVEGQIDRAVQTGAIQYGNRRSNQAMNDDTGFLDLRRGQSNTLSKIWFIAQESAGLLDEYVDQLAVKVVAVQFMDETLTEKLMRKITGTYFELKVSEKWPNGVAPYMLAPEFAVKTDNLPGAPVSISDASVRMEEIWEVNENSRRVIFRLRPSLSNQTDRRVTFYAIDVNNPGFPTGPIRFNGRSLGRTRSIEPRTTLADADLGGLIVNVQTRDNLFKTPGNFSVKVTGVGFEDGSYWAVDTGEKFPVKIGHYGESAPSKPGSQPLFSAAPGGRSGRENPEGDEENREVKDLIDLSSVTTPPKIEHKIHPAYTPEARANGTVGFVLLNVLFRSDGRIGEAKVIRGLPDGLTEQAIEAAKGLRFEPAKKDGRAVSVLSTLEYQFTIGLKEQK